MSSTTSAVEIVLLDLGGAGIASLRLPTSALPLVASPDDDLFAVVPHHSSASPVAGGALALGDAPRSCAIAIAAEEPSLVGIFSARELFSGQLHLRAPPGGVASMRLVPAGAVVAGGAARAARAHLLSAALRLGRRGAAHAAHNAAAAALCDLSLIHI